MKIKWNKLKTTIKDLWITITELADKSFMSRQQIYNLLDSSSDTTMKTLTLIVSAINSYRLQHKLDLPRYLVNDFIENEK